MTVKYIQVHMSIRWTEEEEEEEEKEADSTREEENVFVCMRERRETSYWQRHLLHRANTRE